MKTLNAHFDGKVIVLDEPVELKPNTKVKVIAADNEENVELIGDFAREPDHPAVKLVPLASGGARLTRHPDLIGSTVTHDPAALVQPLPPEEWGDLAER